MMVFGGPDSANDDTEKMKQELQRISEILDAEIPYLGICLGMQALVKAAGGTVRKNKIKDLKKLDSNSMMEDYRALKSQLENNARKILTNFLEIAKVIPLEVSQ